MDSPAEDIVEAQKDAFQGFFQEVRGQMRQMQGETGLIEDLKQFAAAIEWTEPWLVCLLSFEAVLLLSAVLLRKNPYVQAIIFFFCAVTVRCAEVINGYLATRWTEFATQPYFDSRGVFLSAVMSAPLMITMFVIVVNYLLASVSLLVDMKAKELKYKALLKAREEAAAGGAKKEK